MRVLVVEHDPDMRARLRDVLAARGHVVSACASVEDAWAAFGRHAHGLIVLDLDLPGVEGPAFCRRLRSLPQGRRTVVLALTDRTQLGNLAPVLDAGADDYLTKPFALERFSLRLQIAERRAAEVAERERLTIEQRERERLLRSVLTHVRDGLVLVDGAGRFVEINTAALPLLGAGGHADLAGRRVQDFLARGRPAFPAERWQELLDEGALSGEYRIDAADGTALIVEYEARARVLPDLHLCVLRDVTALRRNDGAQERPGAD